MILREQLIAALYGVWLLLRLDPRAFEFFEKSLGGFARSFLPAIVLFPLHLTHEALIYQPGPGKLAFAPYLVVQTLSYVVSCTAFPFVMIYVSRLQAREARYFWYIVPYNWFQLPLGLLFIPFAVLTDLGVVSVQLAAFTNLFALTLFFTFGSFIARRGLQVEVMTSIGIVILDFLLTVLIDNLVSRI